MAQAPRVFYPESSQQRLHIWLHIQVRTVVRGPHCSIYRDPKLMNPHNRDVGLYIFKCGEMR